VTVNPTYSISSSLNICAGDSALIGGVYRLNSGVYTENFSSVSGCDSNVSTTLTVQPIINEQITRTICKDDSVIIGNSVYKTAGVFTDVLQAASTCDSTVTTTVVVSSVDTSVNRNNNVLSSKITGATYQWLDCGNNYAMLAGKTGVSFSPTVNGSYAVRVTVNGCSDTSSCYAITNVGIIDNLFSSSLTVYPNPAVDIVRIESKDRMNLTFELFDARGRKMDVESVKDNDVYSIDCSNFSRGLYVLVIKAGEQQKAQKIQLGF